jgi:hypothetical protein
MGFFYGFAFKDLYDDYKHDPTTVVFDEAVEYVDIDNGRLVLKQDIMNAFIGSIANEPIKHIHDTFAEEVQPEELSMHNWEGYAEWLDEVDNNHNKRGI